MRAAIQRAINDPNDNGFEIVDDDDDIDDHDEIDERPPIEEFETPECKALTRVLNAHDPCQYIQYGDDYSVEAHGLLPLLHNSQRNETPAVLARFFVDFPEPVPITDALVRDVLNLDVVRARPAAAIAPVAAAQGNARNPIV